MKSHRHVRVAAFGARSLALIFMCCVCACGPELLGRYHDPTLPLHVSDDGTERSGPPPHHREFTIEWASETSSPRWTTEVQTHFPQCTGYDAALTQVAQAVADRQAARQPGFELSELVVKLRALGSPHVWPFVWTLEGDELSSRALEERWGVALDTAPNAAQRRCGIARASAANGVEVAALVGVDVLADLAPLPTRARLGQWLRLEARVIGAASGASVILLGPRGTPRTVPSRLTPDRLHSAFALDQQGLWRVQILLGTEQGPRPALEAWVFVDEEPNPRAGSMSAPGEVADVGLNAQLATLRASLFEMLNAARWSEQRAPLGREQRLDDLAQAHAEAMRRSGRTAHDVGQGLPAERVARARLRALRVGENVARARSLPSAHRALWDSPAHRANLLDTGFDTVGLGIAVEPSVGVWVCELFVDYASAVTGMRGRRSGSESWQTEQGDHGAVITLGSAVP